jgi:hypothetical protein
VTENPTWSDGDHKHAIYMVKNTVIQHDEDPNNPWYTPEGRTAAQQSDLGVTSDIHVTDVQAIDGWLLSPFHGLAIMDPHLTQVGYGSFREAGHAFQMGVALNIIAGLDYSQHPSYPVFWPGDQATIPFRQYTGGEYPNPLSSCPGYSVPSGMILMLQIGSGYTTPAVSAYSLNEDGQTQTVCEYDQTNYINSDSSAQALGRSVMAARNAIFLIPRAPLIAGKTYNASVTSNGRVYIWIFGVDPLAK